LYIIVVGSIIDNTIIEKLMGMWDTEDRRVENGDGVLWEWGNQPAPTS